MSKESLFIHLFNMWTKVSYRKLCLLKKVFGSFEWAWTRGKSSNFLSMGFSVADVSELETLRRKIDIQTEIALLRSKKIRLVDRYSQEYPFLLKQISSPPWLLYVRGGILNSELKDIAIVGTRMPSNYGREYADKISELVVNGGGRIVSGLAFGVDACAHKIATENNSPTVAVLASRVDSITPRSNTVLAERILQTGGTIISEYATASDSFKYRFRERNRIIAGMCSATIVIEAGEKSGASITARHAFDQDRDVFALVGDINRPQAQGCIKLIRDEIAHPIIDLRRLSEELGLEQKDENGLGSYANEAVLILDLLNQRTWTGFDDLVRGSNSNPSTLNMLLMMMEIDGLVAGNNGKWKLIAKNSE